MAEKPRQKVIQEAIGLGIEVTPDDLTSEIQQRIYEELDRRAKEQEKLEQRSYYVANDLVHIKVTDEELKELQDSAKLIGYDPTTKEAIVKGVTARKVTLAQSQQAAPVLELSEDKDPNPQEVTAGKKNRPVKSKAG